jgi:Holliday junction resolvase RusA-like endonuclease
MTFPIQFFVAGIPQPGGSKRGFFSPKLKRVIITDANSKAKDWKTSVAQTASEVVKDTGILTGPLKVRMDFVFPRPKGHYRTGKHKGEVRDSAPQYPAVRPDAGKVARSSEDSLTGILWQDDAQIVTEILTKRYGPIPGCTITVRPEA